MKFLCDEMFQRLGSWLRAAGYDTFIEQQGRTDYQLLQQALSENRLLITRDKKLQEHRRAPGTVVLLECSELEDCARELGHKLTINWLHHPFTRCMICNTLLQSASNEHISTLAEKTQSLLKAPVYCCSCNKVYWDGSHIERMRERLEKWQATEIL